MKKTLWFISYIALLSPGLCNALTTSIIIPCHYRHVEHLPNLIENFEMQTVWPDEVIIAISESQHADQQILKQLDQYQGPFSIKILRSQKKHYAGQNRNRACAVASGDLLLTQDADDLCHIQRVEITKYFFEKYNLSHLMHALTEDIIKIITPFDDIASLGYVRINQYSQAVHLGFPITNGNIAIKKKVFNQVKWSTARSGQDVEFNQNVYAMYASSCMILKVPLHLYRVSFSTNAYR